MSVILLFTQSHQSSKPVAHWFYSRVVRFRCTQIFPISHVASIQFVIFWLEPISGDFSHCSPPNSIASTSTEENEHITSCTCVTMAKSSSCSIFVFFFFRFVLIYANQTTGREAWIEGEDTWAHEITIDKWPTTVNFSVKLTAKFILFYSIISASSVFNVNAWSYTRVSRVLLGVYSKYKCRGLLLQILESHLLQQNSSIFLI